MTGTHTTTQSKEVRSQIMRSVKQKDTGPELVVRKALFAEGFRYRLHRKDLPGTPDIVFSSRHKVIFVNGCFWHRHSCKKATMPKTNRAYWKKKFQQNIARDKRQTIEIKKMGWEVLVIWECELNNMRPVMRKLIRFQNKE